MMAVLGFITSHWIALGGLSGIGIASVAYPPFGLFLLDILRAIVAELKKLSPSELGCIGLGIALVWCASWGNHWKAVATERQASLVKLHATLDAETAKNKAAEKQTAQISKQLRDRTDEENRRIAGDADTLRLRGPGKAVCPAFPSGPSNGEGPTKPDVAGPALPPDDRAAVPWGWLVQRSEEHDQLLNEVRAWRDWHEQVLKVWPKTTEAPAK
jgi:hypothetical protein